MWYDKLVDKRLEGLEVEFFRHDPDGDPDRAGSGWYFRLPGENGWSGAWGWKGEARSVAREELTEEYREIEWKIVYFDRPHTGVFHYMAVGIAEKPKLGYDPFAILWLGEQASQTARPFHLLVAGRDAASAKENVRSRLGPAAEFTITKVKGKIRTICQKHALVHPRHGAKDKAVISASG